MTTMQSGRKVTRVVRAVRTLEGAGFVVNRPFPTRMIPDFDPFLLLDQMGPVELAPGEAEGAPDHPHRGFETVTYLLEGRMEHRDSAGNAGRLGPGDVQWMTAGAGVVHSEMPERSFAQQGGRMHGFQLWVNLPRTDKLMAPRYQEVSAAKVPTATRDGVTVKVIAGEALGAKAVIDTRTPIFYLHFRLEPGAKHVQPVSAEHRVFAYVVNGRGKFGVDRAPGEPFEAILFGESGDSVSFENDGREVLELLLIGGVPLKEPVARYGPFVMNTEEELLQAVRDYQSGRMGEIPAHVSRQ